MDRKNALIFFLENVTYSNNKIGFVQAGKFLYNKEVDELTDKQIALLILMTKASTYYDFRRNPARVEKEIEKILNSN